MTIKFITEGQVDDAVHYLNSNADEAAHARANRGYLEDFSKVIEAQLMMEHDNLPIAAQKREALADARYVKHLQAVREARFLDERYRYLRDAKSKLIDAWQTQSANERGKL